MNKKQIRLTESDLKQIVKESTKSREEIIKYFGEARFDQLIEIQKAYMDDFYDKYYAEKEAIKAKEEALNKPEAVEEAKEETPAEEVKAEEAPEVTAEEVKTEEAPEVTETEVTEEMKAEIKHEEEKEIKALEEEQKEEALEEVADSIQESNIVE